jgi:hypothetical protein
MNPHLASSLTLVTAAAAAALVMASGNAYADDITIDNTPFISKASRAEVRSDFKRSGTSPLTEWNTQQSDPVQSNSSYTSSQARSDYVRSRGEVLSVTSEDSGSSYFKMRDPRRAASIMGAPAK